MKRVSIFIVFLTITALIIFFALNPWITDWRDQGILILVFEAVFIVIIGIPVFLYQMIRKKKTFRQSLSGSLDAVLDFISNVG
jgi:Flp pilus assembly protein TadB